MGRKKVSRKLDGGPANIGTYVQVVAGCKYLLGKARPNRTSTNKDTSLFRHILLQRGRMHILGRHIRSKAKRTSWNMINVVTKSPVLLCSNAANHQTFLLCANLTEVTCRPQRLSINQNRKRYTAYHLDSIPPLPELPASHYSRRAIFMY
ncbi:hypothetical protein DE146DRAFT_14547 [Phaeosphaeria sp. MPI-PUGE-AT-0046c]|nr:hypothetical protein DE146DRAFT_14547 [Phaeosphaeria sp. MPI-PUGE-AT-0046c]